MTDGQVGSLGDLLDAYQPPEDAIDLSLDGTAAMRLGRLEQRLIDAREYDRTHNQADTAPDVEAEIEAFRDQYEQSKVTVRLRAASRKVWSDTRAKHPPSEEQRKAGLDHNPDTFWPAVMAHCLIEPAGSVEDVARMADLLPEGEWRRLVECCAALNRGVAPPLDRKLSATLRTFAGSLTTSQTEESPAA